MTRLAFTALALCVLAGCPEQPGFDAGMDAMDATRPMDITRPEAAPDVPVLGRVCRTNAMCDDGLACTDDLCGSDNRCVNLPNNGRCDNNVYCDGPEVCDTRRGCIRGTPVDCNDDYVCTEDRCDEMTRTCVRRPLDRDNDGDPDDHCAARECGDGGVPEMDSGVVGTCWRGRDCDDRNPLVSSLSPEICGDMIDNNCNGAVDDMEPGGCTRPSHDRCDDPLDISAGGVFTLPIAAARPDYTLRCAGGFAHDMVARFTLTEARDINIEGASASSVVALGLQRVCGSTTSADTLDCQSGFPARIRRHSLPAGEYFLIISTTGSGSVDLTVNFPPATPAPSNDTCATAIAIPVPAGGTYRSDLIGVADDVSTSCGGSGADVIYTFTLTEPRDVLLSVAGARTDYLNLSLTRTCARSAETVRCDSGSTVQFTAHELPAGTYFVVVESFSPVPFTLQATFLPPTPPAPGDVCANAVTLTEGSPVSVSSTALENDYALSCSRSGRDSVLRFTLTERRDVVVDVTGGASDFFAVAITSDCRDRPTERTCINANRPRAFAIGLDPGTYYVIVKPNRPADYTVQLTTFPPLAVTNVADNDTCMSAYAIPPGRGYFRGSTTALRNEYNSPCAGMTAGKDAVFRLNLMTSQRVTLVTDSSFFHVVWITQADRCPGSVPVVVGSGTTCTLGTRTTLDAVLPAGEYFIFLDGLSASFEGTYGLLVNLSPP